MLRIAGSHNSKCLREEKEGKDSEVRIIQKWDCHRHKIQLLLGSFYAYLVDRKFREEVQRQKQQRFSKFRYNDNNSPSHTTIIPWIETLVKTPIDDYRKTVIRRILSRYLINKKGLCYDDAFNVIDDWLKKCNSLKRLDSNFNFRIKNNLNYAIKSGRLPISLDTLRSERKELYDIIVSRQT